MVLGVVVVENPVTDGVTAINGETARNTENNDNRVASGELVFTSRKYKERYIVCVRFGVFTVYYV